MATYSKRERVEAALKGETVDRVPVSAWRHFVPDEQAPETLARASLNHFHTFDWDWLKVNPRATYYAEAWGHHYDFNHYDKDYGVIPNLLGRVITSLEDVEKITPRNPTSGVFAEHLHLVRLVKAGIGDAHFVLTIFTPLSVLTSLIAPPKPPELGLAEASKLQYARLQELLTERPQAAHAALSAIAATLAGYAAAAVDAGASGLFLAIVQLAREGVITPEQHAAFGRPYDLQVLQAVRDAPFNLLHICGPQSYFQAVTDYPVHAINWASVGQGNPTVGQAAGLTKQALVGGVDEHETLQHGTPEQVIAEAREAIRATDGKRLLLTPGCAARSDAPEANLRALRKAAG